MADAIVAKKLAKMPSKEELKKFDNEYINNKIEQTTFKRTGMRNGSYFSPNDGIIYLGNTADKYTVIHELGHKIAEDEHWYENKQFIQVLENKFGKYTKKDYTVYYTADKRKVYLLKDTTEFVSKYQTRVYDYQSPFYMDLLI